MRLLVAGGRGQLGSDVAQLAQAAGHQVSAPGSADLDITDADAVDAAVGALRAGGVVLNCAAYTAVDAAESEPEQASAVNEAGPRLLARSCARHGARLVHVSTDYVFPGDGDTPYEPGDRTGPGSVYGQTKLAGERAVLAELPDAHVVRTAWVYGRHGSNFVSTMIRLEGERETVTVVDDQVGSPTWSADLAVGLLELATWTDLPGGARHATNTGATTWCGFAKAIFAELGADPGRVQPCSTADFPRPAPRPAYSVLSDRSWRSAGLTPLPAWDDALRRYLAAAGA